MEWTDQNAIWRRKETTPATVCFDTASKFSHSWRAGKLISPTVWNLLDKTIVSLYFTKRQSSIFVCQTNDVDLDTLSALEEYLAEFKGVLVIVSHDRYFVDKVTEHLFVFEGDGIVKDYLGSLTDYAETTIEIKK